MQGLLHLESTPRSRAEHDRKLVAACLAGDPRAERTLYDAHFDAVYQCAFRLCGDPDTAADITQEAFVRGFANLGQFRGDAALRTWLMAIAVSAAGMLDRKGRGLRSRLEPLHDQITFNSGERLGPDVIADVMAAIARLAEKLRVVFVMHDVEGFTHEEIAAALEIPTGTSKTRLSDARAKLRVSLADHGKDLFR
jgi:RNA polymerase sigma-70 factor, ECF subfamily